MSHPWQDVSGPDEDLYRALAASVEEVQHDTTTVDRFNITASNAARAEFICDVLRIKPEEFSLLLPLPYDEWLVSEDLALVRAGMFLTDMLLSAYIRVKVDCAKPDLFFEEIGELEWWVSAFANRHNRIDKGFPAVDTRTLN